MKRKQPSRKDILSSCDQIGPDDGVDPRLSFRKDAARKISRKTLQLCSETARTVGHTLAWGLGDDLLSRLHVESVVPAPNCSRLLVVVSLSVPPGTIDPDEVRERLRRATGRLRTEVAAAVCRRKVPELAFHLELREKADG